MTAVEWLAEQMLHPENHNPYIEQAKQMEKEQLLKSYIDGSYTGCGCYDYMTEKDAEQYYNETYGK